MLPIPKREKTAIVMVGLPARGKSYIAQKMSLYLAWMGLRVNVFNVGAYRRARLEGQQPAAFFDPDNRQGTQTRQDLSDVALNDMLDWLDDHGDVSIYDATNVEARRRNLVYQSCQKRGVHVIFVESICDQAMVERNIREVKLHSPDYLGWDPNRAVEDFRARISHYRAVYDPVADDDRSYVKIIDVGRQFVVNRMEGYLGSRLIFFLMNLHAARRPIWLTRHGESEHNASGRVGGDSPLTESGEGYARALCQFMQQRSSDMKAVSVWTSTLQRTIATAAPLGVPNIQWRALDEIDAGVCDGLTYREMQELFPAEFEQRGKDKFQYRYPRGESYADLVVRLEPVIVELERQRLPVLVVAHQAILRVLYAYFMGTPHHTSPYLAIPLHTVIELKPHAYGYEEQRYPLSAVVPSARQS